MSFIISGLDPQPFESLASLSDEALAHVKAQWVVVDAAPGFPCRVSLDDAPIGETVLLLNFVHQPAQTPFQASHAIYVRPDAKQTIFKDEIPPSLRGRTLSLRAFDEYDMMFDASVVEGRYAEGEIERLLGDPRTAYLHAHYAGMGCYAARVHRA